VPRAPAIVRRLLPHRLALAAAAVTVTLAATLLAAFASFSATVSSDAVRTSLAGNPGTTVSVTASVTSAAGVTRASGRLVAGLRRALPGLPVTVWSAASSDYLDIPPGRGLPHAETHVISLAALSRHAVLLSGSWPGPGGGSGPVPAAVPAPLARSLHLAPGTVIRLSDGVTGAAFGVRITGIFRPLRADSPYWLLGSAGSGVQISGGFAEYGPLVTSPAAIAGGAVPVASAAWTASPDVSRLGAGDLQALAGRVQSGLNRLGTMAGLQDETVTTNLPGLLTGLGTALVVARSQLAVGAAILLVIAGATLALATVMLSSQRQAETALMASRGASRWQLARTGLAEAGLLIIPAVVAGPLLAGIALPLLARRGPLTRSGLRLPVTFPAGAWVAAAAVAAGCGIVIALPWLRSGRSAVRERAQSGRRAAVAAASRAGGDLALLVLAALAGWQLQHYAAPVSAGLDGSIGIDPILVSAPVLALVAGAVLLLRLLPLVVRLGDRAAARGRAMTAAVAAWQISRRPLRQAGPVLLGVLAVATSVLAVAQWSSWERSARDQASFAAGADVRVDLPPQAPLALGQVTSLTRSASVTGASPAIRTTVVLPTSGTATLLALNARAATSVATVRPDLADGSAAALFGRLSPPGRLPGAPVPGRPARLRITARLTGASAAQPYLFVQVTDAYGISYLLPAGALPARGATASLTVTIAPRQTAAYPLRLTGYTLQYLMPERPVPAAVLSIASVRAAATMTGGFGAPFAASGRGRVSFATSAGDGQITTLPSAGGATAHGDSLSVTFQPGTGITPAQFGAPATPLPASLTANSAGPAGPLPVAATSAFVAATGQGLGHAFPVTVNGTNVPVKVVSVIPAFPTIGANGGNGGLIADQARLQQALATAGAQPLPVTEWWLRTAGGGVWGGRAALTGLPAGAALTDRASIASSLLADPLAVAPQLAMLAIAVAALILAAAGFAVAAATAGERSRDIALLAALGATRRQLTRLLCLEQAALGVPAAAAGLALGAALARLVVPAVTLTATGSHPQPSVLVQIPLAWPLVVALLTAAVPVAIAALGPGRRRGLTAQTRVEVQT
jgi:hypothetical protein